MAVFEYKALNTKGKKITGLVDADSLQAARSRLRDQELYPVNMAQISSGKNEKAGSHRIRFSGVGFSKIRSSDIAMVTRLLATLLSAGFPLVKAVGTVAGQTRSRAFQKVLSRIKDAVEEGRSFSDALKLFPRVFSGVYVNMVAAGESSGTLDIVLERLADFGEHRDTTQKKIQTALAYPVIMSVIGFLVLVILLTYIVPGITQIFFDMNQTLPLPTLILIRVSDFFTRLWWAVLLAPILVCLGVLMIRKTGKGLWYTDLVVIRLPIAGNLIKKIIAARFTRTLGSLLENGVPLLTALTIARKIAGNQVISELIKTAADRVEQGGELGAALSVSPNFPSLASRMIQVGEASGELEKMLNKTADLYERDVQTAVAAATALVEPVIILVMGVVVGLIILAVCLPIVEINQLIM
ncbi:MAG: type II secretion system inner membrane protein GspF [Desulfotignum sp.]|nr:type II secretion system inner membrane protein GspF [Desulfotignum sp.]